MEDKKPDLNGFSFLVADENAYSLSEIKDGLSFFGARVFTANGYEEAAGVLAHQHVNIVIASILLVDDKFVAMISDYKSLYGDSLFFLLLEDDQASVEPTELSVRSVIDDYIKKPIEFDRFARMAEGRIERPGGVENTSLTVVRPLIKKVKPYFLFRSPAMQRALTNITQIAASNETVLVTGETGSGKEIIARAIHALSKRADGPFVPINCGAIPDSLVEAELFGHEKGAFTGAVRARKGRFESADKGTLFLDEIGDMPLNLQVRLLRVLEEKQVFRVGGDMPIPIDVRVVTATRVDLEKAVEDKLFREDLYYRVNVLRLNLPPLCKRKEDIALLAVHFLERAFAEMGRIPPYPELSMETIYILEQYPWKGNVRELRNTMTRVATLLPERAKRIFPFHILPQLNDRRQTDLKTRDAGQKSEGVYIPIGSRLDEVEELLIEETLKQTNGNRTKAAGLLGISLRTLRRKLNKGEAS